MKKIEKKQKTFSPERDHMLSSGIC